MRAVLGRDENGDALIWDFRVAAHSVVAGATRSGKSVVAYCVLAGAAADPIVSVCGLDPSGVLLAPHRHGAPSWRITLGTSDPLAAAHTVKTLVEVMDERNRLLLHNGTDKVPDAAFTPQFPIILVVLEEYAGVLAWLDEADALSKTRLRPLVVSNVGRLLREGAKVGIRVLTILQRPEAGTLHDRAQYARRIALRLDNADSVRMLHEGAEPDAVRRLMDASPGVGLWHEAGKPMQFFRANHLEYSTYRTAVEERHV